MKYTKSPFKLQFTPKYKKIIASVEIGIKKKLERILLDTLEYYTAKDRICYGNFGCRYSGETVGKNTIGCAIGRLLTKQSRIKLDSFDPIGVGVDDYATVIWPEFIRDNLKFFSNLQDLHDKGFDGQYLTTSGKDKVKKLVDDYRFKKELFNKYL